jgi:hypothetical protein
VTPGLRCDDTLLSLWGCGIRCGGFISLMRPGGVARGCTETAGDMRTRVIPHKIRILKRLSAIYRSVLSCIVIWAQPNL